jgi:hypothetical protein
MYTACAIPTTYTCELAVDGDSRAVTRKATADLCEATAAEQLQSDAETRYTT